MRLQQFQSGSGKGFLWQVLADNMRYGKQIPENSGISGIGIIIPGIRLECLCAIAESGIEEWEVSVSKGLLRHILSGNFPSGTLVKRDFTMSNALIDSLETRVNNAVETIESLKSENLALREDRQILEDKLRELLEKFEGVESSDVMTASEPNADSPPDSTTNSTADSTVESAVETRYGLGNLGMGGNSSSSEY